MLYKVHNERVSFCRLCVHACVQAKCTVTMYLYIQTVSGYGPCIIKCSSRTEMLCNIIIHVVHHTCILPIICYMYVLKEVPLCNTSINQVAINATIIGIYIYISACLNLLSILAHACHYMYI